MIHIGIGLYNPCVSSTLQRAHLLSSSRHNPMKYVTTTLSLVLLLWTWMPEAGSAQSSDLSVDQIMQDHETWVGDWPTNLRWAEDGSALYFDWNPEGEYPSDSLYKVSREGGEPQKVEPEERRENRPFFDGWQHGTHTYDADFERKVYTRNGDVYLYHRSDDEVVQLTDTRDFAHGPRFDPDGERVLFQQDDNLFAITLATGAITQLTDLRDGQEPPEQAPDERREWLEEQQLELFETLRERHEEREKREEAQEREERAMDPPPTYHYGDKEIQQLQIDPSERFVTFGLAEESQAEDTQLIDYVTESGYASAFEARPKVGDHVPEMTFHVQDVERDTTYAVDLHQIEGAYDTPPFKEEQGIELDSTEAKRQLYAHGPEWNSDGSHGIVEIRARDNKDRWIARLDPESGDLEVLDRQHDEAWIAGPGISGFRWGSPSTGWLTDDRHFYFQSEATGYSHLYTVDVETGEVDQLTEGEFEVHNPRLSQDGETWFFESSAETPFELHAYQMPVDGGTPERLTSEDDVPDRVLGPAEIRSEGSAMALSPDEDVMGLHYSHSNRPPEVYLHPMNGEPERITHSPTDDWLAYDWRETEITRFEASDGMEVPAQVFEPDDPNGAAVLFVHGAGYLQDVHHGWSNYFREHMFNNLLADLGYTVLNVDYRASAGYGRDWRTAIYRHMGGRDLQDYVDASRYLEEEHDIPGDRTFIYGGSYGGFLTLMALFNEPEHFGGGAALRKVTDWAHYNDPYTSNILNTPTTDSTAYARSSPIHFAEGLEDPLLMTHGLVDDNVQPQDAFRLSQRFIEMGKEDWELAVYPIEDHGFEEPSSWADQYRRILEYIEDSVGPDAE